MKKFLVFLCAAVLVFSFAACAPESPSVSTYQVSGAVKLDGAGLQNVQLKSGGNVVATTDAGGAFSIAELKDDITITPYLEGYEFSPEKLAVSSAREDLDFTANQVEKTDEDPVVQDPTKIAEPTDGSLYDGFNDGINPKGKWDIVSKKWGAAEFNGVTPSNVQYTADGTLVLQSKGNYYNNAGERNTGACIASKEALGPGKYEVAAKISPRLGMCSAIWTFYYESESINHEIDIEFPGKTDGRIGYDTVMNTNWTGTSQYTSLKVNLPTKGLTAQNDGKWHKYGFEWSVKNKSVKYYIDDVMTSEITADIPSIKGQLWIGVWEPVDWAGVPQYETSDMLVDWVAYTPFDETAADGVQEANPEYLERKVAGEKQFPTAPIELKEPEFISNGGFDEYAGAWQKTTGPKASHIIPTNYLSSDYAYRAVGDTTVKQEITAVYAGFQYNLEGYAKLVKHGADSGLSIKVDFVNAAGEVIADKSVELKATGTTDYEKLSAVLTAPEGCVAMRVWLVSEGSGTVGCFDNLKITGIIAKNNG